MSRCCFLFLSLKFRHVELFAPLILKTKKEAKLLKVNRIMTGIYTCESIIETHRSNSWNIWDCISVFQGEQEPKARKESYINTVREQRQSKEYNKYKYRRKNSRCSSSGDIKNEEERSARARDIYTLGFYKEPRQGSRCLSVGYLGSDVRNDDENANASLSLTLS